MISRFNICQKAKSLYNIMRYSLCVEYAKLVIYNYYFLQQLPSSKQFLQLVVLLGLALQLDAYRLLLVTNEYV